MLTCLQKYRINEYSYERLTPCLQILAPDRLENEQTQSALIPPRDQAIESDGSFGDGERSKEMQLFREGQVT